MICNHHTHLKKLSLDSEYKVLYGEYNDLGDNQQKFLETEGAIMHQHKFTGCKTKRCLTSVTLFVQFLNDKVKTFSLFSKTSL